MMIRLPISFCMTIIEQGNSEYFHGSHLMIRLAMIKLRLRERTDIKLFQAMIKKSKEFS